MSTVTLSTAASDEFIDALPKAELHVHIEGTILPNRLMTLADANGVSLPYADEVALLKAYDFEDLQSFLDLYYLGAGVLKTEADFYAITMDYLEICRKQNILHTEIGFDPQAHMHAGVPFAVVIAGITQAMQDARAQWGQSALLILNFLRHLSPDDAMKTIDAAQPFTDAITAVGLDSSELGFPPEPFEPVFARAKSLGWRAVAHAGEEGPPSYIWGALNALKVERVDHGVRCGEDADLLAHLVQSQIPLTVCPLSNVRLRVFDKMADHNVLRLLDAGVCVTLNSDDPSYFGGHLNENFHAVADDLGLNVAQAGVLACNSFVGSFLSAEQKNRFQKQVKEYLGETVTCKE